MFVYKVVHDLKHPQRALYSGLTDIQQTILLKDQKSARFFSKDDNFRTQRPVVRALRELKAHLNLAQSEQGPSDRSRSSQNVVQKSG